MSRINFLIILLFIISILNASQKINIGKSVGGVVIYSYVYGVGHKRVLLIGGIHGDEANSSKVLYSLIRELERDPGQIPKNIMVVIVPSINPDGIKKNSRFNLNGVDLNRNFKTSSWGKDSFYLNHKKSGGGGNRPFSEPETKILSSLISKYIPYLTISYHSKGGVVVPNSQTKSAKYAKFYSKISGYFYAKKKSRRTIDSEYFSYPITGSLGEYLARLNLSCITIELFTSHLTEYTRNRLAIFALLNGCSR